MSIIEPADFETGISDGLSSILDDFEDETDFYNTMYGDASGFGLDVDVQNYIENHAVSDTAFMGGIYAADPGLYVKKTFEKMVIETNAHLLEAQKGLYSTVFSAIKNVNLGANTLEWKLTGWLDSMPARPYVEKATGKFVQASTGALYATELHYGAVISGLGKLVGNSIPFVIMYDTIVASYNASTGHEADPWVPVEKYLIASAIAIGMALVTGPTWGAAMAGAVIGGTLGWVTHSVIEAYPAAIAEAKALGKTLGEVLDMAQEMITDAINEAWTATGSALDDILDYAAEVVDDLYTAAIEYAAPHIVTVADAIDDVAEFFGFAEETRSPLVLDLAAAGINLTELNEDGSVYWDIDNDGMLEASGWVGAGMGLLAVDLNENGGIDSQAELFGNQLATGADNGFEALAAYDSNSDGVINSSDANWSDLLVWVDANGDGYSQESEIYTLDELAITSISLAYTDVNYEVNGNTVRQESTFQIDGQTHDIVDVWFAYDDVNTVYGDDFEYDPTALFLPEQRGYGTLPTLAIAMSIDNDGAGNLLSLVEDFATQDFEDFFDGSGDVASDVRDILFRWAGVDGVSPASRGAYADGQELAFLEHLLDKGFLQRDYYSDPSPPGAAMYLAQAFDTAFNHFYSNLLVQTAAADLFEGVFFYDATTDAIDTTGIVGLDLDRIDELETTATGLGSTVAKQVFWNDVVRLIDYAFGVANLDGGDQTALDDAITASDGSLSLTGILADVNDPPGYDATLDGTSGADTLTGGSGDDLIFGNDLNDTLDGGAGDDEIQGGLLADTLIGGDGADFLLGGAGDDLYIYNAGDGADSLYDASGTDKILFGAGIDSGDLTLTRVNNSDLLISIDNGSFTGSLYLADHFLNGSAVETIEFNDTSTLNLTNINNWVLDGGIYKDVLNGVQYNGGADDIINGNGGDDTIYGWGGQDTLSGGDGHDQLAGGDGNDTLDGGAGSDHMLGGGGDDVYYVDHANDLASEYLGSGYDTVYASLSYSLASSYSIETLILTGTGDFDGIGVAGVNNTLIGNSGNNTLDGLSGADSLIGGDGNDTYIVDNAGDVVIENADEGTDTVISAVSWTLGDHSENLVLTGFGSIHGTGNAFVNTITGNTGANTLDGGGGADTLAGGVSNDTYIVDDAGDVVIENVSEGADTVRSSVSYTLGDHLENLVLTGTGNINGTGNSANNTITGNTGDNSLSGGDGNDTLDGGAGADVLAGGDGNDVFYVDNAGDVVTEALNEGNADHVFSSVSFALPDNVERVTLTGSSNINATGNGLGNVLNGNSGSNTLDGGAGNDVMTGGDGDDVYFVDSALDSVFETYTTGNDHVFASASFTISNGVESLTLTGSSNINATGNTGVNTLTGNTGDNTLDGIYGADTMAGGQGNDTYVLNTGSETLIEYNGEGTDTVRSWVTHTLGDYIENLTLLSSAALNGTGNALDNVLTGNINNNTLSGEGGSDTLTGGTGADAFVFSASSYGSVDIVTDFNTGQNDVIDLHDVISAYEHGVDVLTDWVRFSDDSGNTKVEVDIDGAGGGYGWMQIATLSGVTGLTDEAALVSSGNLVVA